jgi:hypothetical protein
MYIYRYIYIYIYIYIHIQDQAEQMHLQLLRSIEEINQLSIFLGFSVQYSIKKEDRNLVRSGRESGI